MRPNRANPGPEPAFLSVLVREESAIQRCRTDVNFGSIVNLDAAGGWHVLRLAAEGSFAADAAALKVLRQFFPGDPGWSGGLPAPLQNICFEARDWGMNQALSRSWRCAVFSKSGLKLTAHFVPDAEGGYVVLKTGSAALAVDTSALPLTDREQEISALVAAGKTNCEIGFLLSISARTVQKHLENIFRKLGLETRMALAMKAASLQPDFGT